MGTSGGANFEGLENVKNVHIMGNIFQVGTHASSVHVNHGPMTYMHAVHCFFADMTELIVVMQEIYSTVIYGHGVQNSNQFYSICQGSVSAIMLRRLRIAVSLQAVQITVKFTVSFCV